MVAHYLFRQGRPGCSRSRRNVCKYTSKTQQRETEKIQQEIQIARPSHYSIATCLGAFLDSPLEFCRSLVESANECLHRISMLWLRCSEGHEIKFCSCVISVPATLGHWLEMCIKEYILVLNKMHARKNFFDIHSR